MLFARAAFPFACRKVAPASASSTALSPSTYASTRLHIEVTYTQIENTVIYIYAAARFNAPKKIEFPCFLVVIGVL